MRAGVVLFIVGAGLVCATITQERPWQAGFALGVVLLILGGTIVADTLYDRDLAQREREDTLSELEVRAWAQRTGRCRDCRSGDDALDRFGRCAECAEEIDRKVADAEARAGWDPSP